MRATTVGTSNFSLASRAQHVLVEAVAVDLAALEVEAQHPERDLALVDDGDRMTPPLEPVGQLRADPATTHDHDVHAVSFPLTGPSNRTAVRSGAGGVRGAQERGPGRGIPAAKQSRALAPGE